MKTARNPRYNVLTVRLSDDELTELKKYQKENKLLNIGQAARSKMFGESEK